MDLRVGALAARGLRQMRAQISALYIIVLDFLLFGPIFISERSECEWGRKTGQNFALLTACEKYRRAS